MVMPIKQVKPNWLQRLGGRIMRLGEPAARQPGAYNSGYYQSQNNYAHTNQQYTPYSNTSHPGNIAGTAPEDQEAKRQIIKVETIGAPGTIINAGYISEDYLHQLQGHERADKIDIMRRSDAQIKMLLSAVKNPIISGSWEFEPGDDSDEQKMYADFMNHLLFEALDEPWSQFLTEALTTVDFGYSLFELTDKAVLNHPKWGNYNAIKQLGWRSQRTIHRFNVEPLSGKLLSVSQYVYGDMARVVDIPAEYILLFTMNREGSNYEGISLLRNCYGNWFRKEHYMRMNAIGIERFAIPTPIATIPQGAQGTEQYGALVNALEVYTTHESNYLIVPEGFTIDFHNNVYDPSKVEASIDAEDKRMTKVFLANFLELGLGGKGGAYALSNDLSDFFLGGIKGVANIVCEGINQIIIPRMIKMNFGPQLVYPKLKVSGIDDKAGEELSRMLKEMADSQYITPDDQLEEHLRKRMGLPKMSKIGQRAVKAVGAAGSAGPANPSFTQLAERIRLAEQRRVGNGQD
jgi:hypothetical protein